MYTKSLGSLLLLAASVAISLQTAHTALGEEDANLFGLSANYENVFLTPHLTGDTAVERRASGIGSIDSDEQFDHDFAYSPRISLGYLVDNGFAIRTRYWRFGTGASELFTAGTNETLIGRFLHGTSGALAAGTDSSILAGEEFDILTLDFEASQRLEFCCWEVNAGGGFRHVGAAFRYDAQVINPSGALLNRRDIDHRFDGVGPTLFAELRRPLGETGFSFLANTRFSILFGDSKSSSFDTSSVGVVANESRFSESTHARIGEIQLGLEWARPIFGDGRLFVQTLWEAQAWENFGYDVPIQSSSQRSESFEDLGLLGASFAVGIEL